LQMRVVDLQRAFGAGVGPDAGPDVAHPRLRALRAAFELHERLVVRVVLAVAVLGEMHGVPVTLSLPVRGDLLLARLVRRTGRGRIHGVRRLPRDGSFIIRRARWL